MKFKIVLLICFVVAGLQIANFLIAQDWELYSLKRDTVFILIQNRLIGLSDTKILKVDSALLQRENNMVIISSSFNNKLYLRDFISTSLVGQDDKIIINAMFPIIFGIKKNRN